MSAPGVLLLPGWGTGPELLAPLAPRSAAGVVSPRWDAARSADALAPLALEAAAGAPGDGLVVVAWSLGAMVALEALPALAGRVRALLLVAPCLSFTAGWPRRVLERMRRRCADDPAATLAAFAGALLAPGEAGPPLIRARADQPVAALQAGLDYLATRALAPPAAPPGCAVRVIHGGAVEKMNSRARFRSHSTASASPQATAPWLA